MAYSDSFPAVRPVFQADFANGGRIPPNATFSRSDTPPTYAAPSAVHYWSNEKHLSSENLFTHSASSYLWSVYNGASKADGAANGPDGSTNTAYSITFDDTSQYVNTSSVGLDTSASYTFSFYAKVASGTQTISIGNIATGVFTNITVTTDWQRFSVTQTPTATTRYPNIRPNGATGLGTLLIWGAQLEKRGSATALNETSGQIHREYAPTLKSVSYAGQPRFEYSPTDGESAGTSLGILIEGQSTNLMPYSRNGYNADPVPVFQHSLSGATGTVNALVAPSGQLEATLVTEGSNTGQHSWYKTLSTSAAAYTFSAYVKDAGVGSIVVRLYSGATAYGRTFNLANGTSSAIFTAPDAYSIEPCGNGWYRVSLTATLTAASWTFNILAFRGAVSVNYVGDSYSGFGLYGLQVEQSSHHSSYIDVGTSGGSVTRAADSLSVDTSSFYTGGPVSIVGEASFSSPTSPAGGYDPRLFRLHKDSSNYAQSFRLYSDNTIRTQVFSDGAVVATFANTATSTVADTYYKFASRISGDNYGATLDGATPATDTSGQLPDLNGATLYIGKSSTQGEINGHIKRIAVYGDLSDTNLQAITS